MSNQYGPRIVTDGLVLHLDAANRKSYPGTGTAWNDLSGNGNDGAFGASTAAPTFSSANGGCLSFDGTDDTVEVTSFPQIFSNSVSMCGWFYFDTGNARDILFSSFNGSYGIAFEKHLNDRLRLYWNHNGSVVDTLSTNNAVSSQLWQHICIQRNKENNSIDFYANSVLKNTQNVSTLDVTNSLTTFRIGRDSRTNDGTPLSGKIAQVSIYNKALSANEVLQNYNATKGRFGL